ncbi:hypothetical protein AB0C02_33445 [Micromonospora sp. NPDC048999]|uniref:hypothetical protein n=1 Tax=Micromonospora sp. NPDC048999 TaxID=3155391 RepID=UPI003410EEF3
MTTIEEFRDIWDAPLERYVLIRLGNSREQMIIFDPESRMAQIIEDDELALKVIDKMIERGFAILDHIPEGNRE